MPELKWSIGSSHTDGKEKGKLWEHWPVKEGRKRSERGKKIPLLLMQ